jgi:hypothetical protein
VVRFLLLLLFLGPISYAQDDQTVLDVGTGVFNSTEMRTISLGIQEDLWYTLKQRAIGGFWVDNTSKGSVFLSGQLGFEVKNGGAVASVFSGPCVISSPDQVLGGYLQFMSDLHLGLQDRDLNQLGVFFRHISSAGFATPNLGRDILGLEIRF